MSIKHRVPTPSSPRNAIRAALAIAFESSSETDVAYTTINGLPYAEIAPCRFAGDAIEMTSEGQAEFWTVYTRDPHQAGTEIHNLARAISDFESRAQAVSFVLNSIGPEAKIEFRHDFVPDPVDLTGEDATLTVDWNTGAVLAFSGDTEHGLATFGKADMNEYREFMAANDLGDKPSAIDWILVSGSHIDGRTEEAEIDARNELLICLRDDSAPVL